MTDQIISEDTPEDNVEELKWKIDRLVDQVRVHSEEAKKAWDCYHKVREENRVLKIRFERLADHMTIKQLNAAGFRVTVVEKEEDWEDCDEGF